MGRGVRILSFSLSLLSESAEAICTYSIECTYRYTTPKTFTDSVLDAVIDMQVTLPGLG